MLDLEVLYDPFVPTVHGDPYPVYEVAWWLTGTSTLAAATRLRSGPVRGDASLPNHLDQ